MMPKMFAFDLDGTLLDANKRISPANIAALREMAAAGAVIALASGRIGFSVRRYVSDLGFDPALVLLNGAEVFTSASPDAQSIYTAPLASQHAKHLTDYAADKPIAVNFYHEDKIHTVKSDNNEEWIELYRKQIGVDRVFLDDFSTMNNVAPSKIIFIADQPYIDKLEKHFHSLWASDSVYVCRSWRHYLEFMNPKASKGIGLKTLGDALGIKMSETVAYGDEENDIPMLETAGMGVAMKNATEKVKKTAKRITELTNDEDWVAREWKNISENYYTVASL
ncbi:MAG: Cof-type HAD-IIB family hydrolase [Chitinispirillales bacterium]|jgi:Cof subfamily protein (haloacid dehalogenase superfamily)|nr:Cof-type HAD-IIB family hydrolase [Chitinispirillales bacterium]